MMQRAHSSNSHAKIVRPPFTAAWAECYISNHLLQHVEREPDPICKCNKPKTGKKEEKEARS